MSGEMALPRVAGYPGTFPRKESGNSCAYPGSTRGYCGEEAEVLLLFVPGTPGTYQLPGIVPGDGNSYQNFLS
eukprot:647121-Rhodomonas_salina.3